MKKILFLFVIIITGSLCSAQESTWAKIVSDTVVRVEVVSDAFVAANPARYSGTWKKVGTVQQPFIGKGYVYVPDKDSIVVPPPYKSWSLDAKYQWAAPSDKPAGEQYWDEKTQEWKPVPERK